MLLKSLNPTTPFVKEIIRTHGFTVSVMNEEDWLRVMIMVCISMMSLNLYLKKKSHMIGM